MAVRYEGQIPRVNQTVAPPPGPVRGAAPPPIQEPAPAAPAAPVRTNFSWGVQGKGVEGVDWGNTASWDDAKWRAFEGTGGQGWGAGGAAAPAAPAAGPAAPAAPAGPAGPITTAQGVTGTTATVGGGAAQGAPTTVAESFQQALINRMNPGAAGAGSASISPAIQANKLAEQRGFERNRNLLAERAAATGTNNSGGFESQLLGLAQDRAQREGQFEGDAVQREQERLDRNQGSALGMAGSMLTGQQGFGLQESLANLDAQLRREGIGAQTALGN